jgi:formylmethanofuran dehydrogenase subunit E
MNYNIENIEEMMSEDGTIILSSKSFTKCLMCDSFFLNEKEKIKQGKIICPKCSEIVKHLAEKI